LRASEGRDTEALNCKPITNLKEKYELSNYCKTSGFILHAVSNGLRANEGRETKALNCKPNTNLKEIFELSN
jgi:hypothetical protein